MAQPKRTGKLFPNGNRIGVLLSTARRREDVGVHTRFRSERFTQQHGKWYFFTREGSVEGPFDYRRAAENRLADYIKVMTSGVLEPDCALSILPHNPA